MGAIHPGAAVDRRGRTLVRIDPARPESVSGIRTAVSAFAEDAGATPETLAALRLTVSEAVTNAVLHAYRGRPGHVCVSAWASPGRLDVHVSDDGAGLRTGSSRAGLGLGLVLISQLCETFELAARSTGGTEVRMQFALPVGESD